MSNFTTPLQYVAASRSRNVFAAKFDRRQYRIMENFSYCLDAPGSKIEVQVMAGFVTDLASIPWGLRWLFPPNGKWSKAAVIHDWGYCGGQIILPDGQQLKPSRFWWDVIFLEAMAVSKVPPLTRWLFFVAVRAFGGVGWRAKQQ